MPQLHWNETDFLDFFAVLPTIEDYEVSHHYTVERGGLRLSLTLWQYESVVQASLQRADADVEIFTFAASIRGEVRLIDDKQGRYLEFEDCILSPSRTWYIQAGNLFDQQRFPASITIRLEIDPEIHIGLVNYESRT